MKKQLIVAAGLAILSTSAFATKARLEALGQNDDRGSYYLGDARNMFANPAAVNDYKNFVVTEWGTADNNVDDATTAPHAEGGFYREMGSFAYGLYLGSQVDANNTKRAVDNFQAHDNGLDLFFGGDMGVKWGARLHYAKSMTETNAANKLEHSALGVGLGVIMGDLEAYTNLRFKDESKGTVAGTAADIFEGDVKNFGVAYNFAGTTFFADYDELGSDKTVSSVKTEVTNTTLTVGAGRIHEVSSTSRVIFDIAYVSDKTETKTTTTTEATDTHIPITFGFEADATSWLTLRGSVSQQVLIGQTETKTTATDKASNSNTTNVAAGATLNFGKLKIDGLIGTTGFNRVASTQTENGTLALDNLMTRVSVHYWF